MTAEWPEPTPSVAEAIGRFNSLAESIKALRQERQGYEWAVTVLAGLYAGSQFNRYGWVGLIVGLLIAFAVRSVCLWAGRRWG